MEQSLFTITCTTCQARLAVRDASWIGAILPCPKCGSLVQVTAPPEGVAPASDEPVSEPANPPAAKGESKAVKQPLTPLPHPPSPAKTRPIATPTPAPVQTPTPAARASGDVKPVVPPPVPLNRPRAASPGPAAASTGPVSAGALAEEISPDSLAGWTSPTELRWRKALLFGGAALVGVVLLTALIVWVLPKGDSAASDSQTTGQTEPGGDSNDAKQAEATEPPIAPREWLPDDARLVVRLRPSSMAGRSDSGRVLDLLAARWPASLAALLKDLGLRPSNVRSLTWSSNNLVSWTEPAIVLIELEKNVDAAAVAEKGEPIDDVFVRGKPCRRLVGSAWAHPIAMLSARTLVTGPASILGETASRKEPRPASPAIGQLASLLTAEAENPSADAVVLLDLAAARGAKWPLPVDALDVWPQGEKSWRTLWTTPTGLGLAVRCGATVRTDLDLLCADPTAAGAVQAAWERLVPAARDAIGQKVKALPDMVAKGQFPAAGVDRYRVVLNQTLATLQLTQWTAGESTVRVSTDWGPELAAALTAALAAGPEVRADWLASAATLDRARLEALGGALKKHAAAEGRLPEGAVGGALLPPETRLSWIATLLPYLEHEDWHKELQQGYSWDNDRNTPVTRRPLAEVVNPTLGPGRTPDGFPVTHYVGVAGVGPDAGKLSASDPRAGVFGFGRTLARGEIRDGAGNTIAVLGACDHLGSWAAGGQATVRPLTKRPYVNGPDGFGSGQPGGMLAGMADGSVRFLSADTDPAVLEAMATANGSERVAAEEWNPRPAGPGGQPPKHAAAEPGAKPNAAAAGKEPDAAAPPAAQPSPEMIRKLAQPIAEMDYANVPLGQVTAFFEQFGAVRIPLDPAVLAQAGASPTDPVNLRLKNTTLAQALRSALNQRGLDFVAQGDKIVLFPLKKTGR